MKKIYIQFLDFRFEHPAQEEPSWKEKVERWYQLDAFSYGLAEAYSVWKSEISSPPALMILASPQASNETDFQFTQGGATSPAKFVHTLANIRCSPLCQVMDWSGAVLCVQKDPFTQVSALREAAALFKAGRSGPVWVVSVFSLNRAGSPSIYQSQAFILSEKSEQAAFTLDENLAVSPLQTDKELQEWLSLGPGPGPTFPLPGGFELRKNR